MGTEEVGVHPFVRVPCPDAGADRGSRAKRGLGKEFAVRCMNLNGFTRLGIIFDACDGPRKYPGMALFERFFAPGFKSQFRCGYEGTLPQYLNEGK
ncbi:MAG TPA: hypothetical protein VI451_05150 [Anaerolineales bacterium]|nr:hypothetical protein [Anaerolineales bacterium]